MGSNDDEVPEDGLLHDEVEIEDFEYDLDTDTFTYPCPCGDEFVVNRVSKVIKTEAKLLVTMSLTTDITYILRRIS